MASGTAGRRVNSKLITAFFTPPRAKSPPLAAPVPRIPPNIAAPGPDVRFPSEDVTDEIERESEADREDSDPPSPTIGESYSESYASDVPSSTVGNSCDADSDDADPGSPAPAPAAVQAAGVEAPAEANGSENGNGTEAEAPSEPQLAVSPAPGTPLINPTWYPTVSRTLVLLSKLYRSVQKPAFQALSQELMNACLESLSAAEVTVTAKAGKTNGQLFMIMHLLILREQIAPFDVEFTKTEKFLDFAGFLGSLKGAATDLYATQQSTGLLTDGGAAFMSFLQRTTPKILETKEDSRLDMETKLKNICMAFMQAASRTMTAPLQSFLVKVDALGEDAKKTLSAQAFATPEKVRALVAETTGQMRTQMASVTKSTSVYLDTKTVKILLDQIQANTVAAFQRFHTAVQTFYVEEDDLNIIGLPTVEQIKLTLQG